MQDPGSSSDLRFALWPLSQGGPTIGEGTLDDAVEIALGHWNRLVEHVSALTE